MYEAEICNCQTRGSFLDSFATLQWKKPVWRRRYGLDISMTLSETGMWGQQSFCWKKPWKMSYYITLCSNSISDSIWCCRWSFDHIRRGLAKCCRSKRDWSTGRGISGLPDCCRHASSWTKLHRSRVDIGWWSHVASLKNTERCEVSHPV